MVYALHVIEDEIRILISSVFFYPGSSVRCKKMLGSGSPIFVIKINDLLQTSDHNHRARTTFKRARDQLSLRAPT